MAKKLYFNKCIINSNNKIKTTWNLAKSITNRKTTSNNLNQMNIEGRLSGNPLTIANAFNSYFISAVENILEKYPKEYNVNNNTDALYYLQQNINRSFPNIKFKNITSHEIEKIINSLKCKNSYGDDEISVKILKISEPFIISPLTFIANKMLYTGIFPDRMKYAVVKPLYKKRGKSNFSNYRPISLLTSFSKDA
jgi:hypothetical protein